MKKKQPKIQAVIFDMDGVISDTQVIHAQAESDLLRDYGIEMGLDEITERFAGVAAGKMFEQIFEEFRKELPALNQMVEEKWTRIELLAKGNIKEIPGTRDFIEHLKNRKMPLAVASASRLYFIDLVLSELDLGDKFDAIASAEEVEKGKPEPDVFLLAAERLSVLPDFCLVIEDGVSGMVAAKKAGMRCVALVRDGKKKDYPADLVVKNLREALPFVHSLRGS